MDDCKYKNEDCNNETVCPCLRFIQQTRKDYKKMLQSDLWNKIVKEIKTT